MFLRTLFPLNLTCKKDTIFLRCAIKYIFSPEPSQFLSVVVKYKSMFNQLSTTLTCICDVIQNESDH